MFYLLVSGQILILFTGLSVTCDGASDGAELETKDSAAFTFKPEITFEFKVKKKILPSKQKSHDCHCICVMPVQLTSKITNNFMEVDYNVRIVNINADRNSSTSILKL